MATVSQLPPTVATATRVTKEGRKLTYKLRVIQQPERARACGSGAKASADRRPVDPPPVVELRIWEGEGPNQNDITFSYNANFFLYTDLELDRPIINGRVQGAAPQTTPVLTGCPVSGMAYLDRPDFAGYFIFPDLSVRHEGKYKLSFNLYEQTKEARDEDAEPQDPKNGGKACPDGSFDWRLKIQSNPFTVFSAKKFPGLAESTPLSRTVAEQGCRVRIRRDVRMRRRDGKAGGDYDDDRKSETPEEIYTRQRSLSVEIQPHNDIQRRGSYEAAYQSSPSPLGPPANPAQSGNYLQFASSGAPQFPAPAPPQQAHQMIQPPPQPQYFQGPQPGAYQSQAYPQPRPPTQYGYYERPQQFAPYGSVQTREQSEEEYQRSSVYHRASVSYPSTPGSQYPAADPNLARSHSISYAPPTPQRGVAPANHPSMLAPLKMAPVEPKFENHSSPTAPLSARNGPPQVSPSYHERVNPHAGYAPTPAVQPAVEPGRVGKRPFDAAFAAPNYHQPLHNGMRPSDAYVPIKPPSMVMYEEEDDDDEGSYDTFKMQYRRADGTAFSRELPMLE